MYYQVPGGAKKEDVVAFGPIVALPVSPKQPDYVIQFEDEPTLGVAPEDSIVALLKPWMQVPARQ